MNRFNPIWTALAYLILALTFIGEPVYAKQQATTATVDCNKDDLQKAIDGAVGGSALEISGVCMANVRIDGKSLTLKGAAGPGPHGITGTAPDTPSLEIFQSSGTVIENLEFKNSASVGIRAEYSIVTITDSDISDNTHSGIIALGSSRLTARRVRLDNNSNGVQGIDGSVVFCFQCDVNDNSGWAAISSRNALVTLIDSLVTGDKGLLSLIGSYLDIDCLSESTGHGCNLNVSNRAAYGELQSTVVFFHAGDFWGQLTANDRSEIQLLGARQRSLGNNDILSGASILVQPFSGSSSQLQGVTNISGFSRAQFYGGTTVLAGTLDCTAAGDAWIDAGVDKSGATVNGCAHAP